MFGILGDIITFWMMLTAIRLVSTLVATWATKSWAVLVGKLVDPATNLIKKFVPAVVVGTHDLSPAVLLAILFGLQQLLPVIETLL